MKVLFSFFLILASFLPPSSIANQTHNFHIASEPFEIHVSIEKLDFPVLFDVSASIACTNRLRDILVFCDYDELDFVKNIRVEMSRVYEDSNKEVFRISHSVGDALSVSQKYNPLFRRGECYIDLAFKILDQRYLNKRGEELSAKASVRLKIPKNVTDFENLHFTYSLEFPESTQDEISCLDSGQVACPKVLKLKPVEGTYPYQYWFWSRGDTTNREFPVP